MTVRHLNAHAVKITSGALGRKHHEFESIVTHSRSNRKVRAYETG